MLDIKLIQNSKEEIETALLKRMNKNDLDLDKIISLDNKKRELLTKKEALQSKRNKGSKTKPNKRTVEAMKTIGSDIKKLDKDLDKINTDYNSLISALPNIPANDVVSGGKEYNKVLKSFREQPKFDFETKDHIEKTRKDFECKMLNL